MKAKMKPYNPIADIIKVSPFEDGVSPAKAAKMAMLLGYKSGTIHKVKNKKYHPCIDNNDFMYRYFKLMKEKSFIIGENGKIIIEFN